MQEFKVGDRVKVQGKHQGPFMVEVNINAATKDEYPLKVGTNTYTKYGQFFSDNGSVFLTLIERPNINKQDNDAK